MCVLLKIITSYFNNIMEEVINLNLEDLSSDKSSTLMGSGVELLMNTKSSSKNKSENKSENIESLEQELNNLTNDTDGNIDVKTSTPSVKENLFNTKNHPINISSESIFQNVKIDDNVTIIGDKTAQQESNNNKTWDGFQQFNDIPSDPTNPTVEPKMSKDQLLREKFVYLKRLEGLERRGINLSQKYTIDSSLNEMKGEYEMIKSEKEKTNSIKFQAKMLMACVTGIEFLNNRFDPFDVNLDSWGETVNENINDYDDVFAELHEKYQSKAKIAPELKLLFMLGGSAVMCHMTNTMFKSAIPGMDDILKQNPDLMKQFAGAAASSMQKENTGFSNFMGDIMGGGGGAPAGTNVAGNSMRGGNNNISSGGTDFNLPSYNARTESMSSTGIDINDNASSFSNNNNRPEMRGPTSDINSILSNIKQTGGVKNNVVNNRTKGMNMSDDTLNSNKTKTIYQENKQNSVNEIMLGGSLPQRTNRKKGTSEKNTVQLDI
jgi:hypothetical protein